MKNKCEARLRSLLAADEPALAVGTAEELGELKSDIGSGGGWTFLLLSPRRLLFANWGDPDSRHHEIALEEVSRWADGTQYNCYAVVLSHPPMARREHQPAHRFLWFKWGNASAERQRTTTIFRFSRRDTKAAQALRTALEQRNIPHQALQLDEVSREQRTRGSRAVVRPNAK